MIPPCCNTHLKTQFRCIMPILYNPDSKKRMHGWKYVAWEDVVFFVLWCAHEAVFRQLNLPFLSVPRKMSSQGPRPCFHPVARGSNCYSCPRASYFVISKQTFTWRAAILQQCLECVALSGTFLGDFHELLENERANAWVKSPMNLMIILQVKPFLLRGGQQKKFWELHIKTCHTENLHGFFEN